MNLLSKSGIASKSKLKYTQPIQTVQTVPSITQMESTNRLIEPGSLNCLN